MDLYTAMTRAESVGISVPRQVYAERTDDLLKKSTELTYPLVAKLVSRKPVHKTDKGGIVLGIKTPEELVKAYEKIRKAGKKDFLGVLVQEQVKGIEVIIGGKTDPQFGPVLLFGLGGIFTEIFQDYSLRILPVNKRKATEMIKEIKAYPVLKGYRGKQGVNLKKLADTIVKASTLFNDPRIQEFDMNPVMCTKKDCTAVDARIITL